MSLRIPHWLNLIKMGKTLGERRSKSHSRLWDKKDEAHFSLNLEHGFEGKNRLTFTHKTKYVELKCAGWFLFKAKKWLIGSSDFTKLEI